ncbi:hypothetical protein [Myxacorys almedinensis]|uniref:Uncharacterized protein n=1 Tax=Myxacorys almedinensis A TaxID=2690445 RepID=A0A8J7Z783_9CYAN|nr:hypothetical protein [Myxacorys almedinensis]NDJ16785.1 hypothetical protein [Myxacorys almedinensis A]
MSHPILQLGNVQNWTLLYSETLNAEETFAGRGFRPIPARLIPLQIEHRILIVGTASNKGIRSTWNTGGWITPLIAWGGNNNTMDADLGSWRIPLNKQRLILLPDIAPNYKLRFSTPSWMQQMSVTIYQYSGPEDDSTELLIGQLQTQLDRIEGQISPN